MESEGQTKLHVIYIDYLAELCNGDLKPDSDVGEAKWVPRKDLPGISEELHEDTRKFFRIANII